MKKALLIIVIIIFSAPLYSAEPLVRFYLLDGSTKQYNLGDIDSFNVIDKKNNYVMRIHYKSKLIAYYPTEIIASIKFEKDSVQRDILNVYIFSYPKSYILSSIDSVIFYIDQYQPLTIGSQVWMLKNLNVDHYRNGDSILEVRDSVTWSDEDYSDKWCYYNNNPAIGAVYGKLYNWYAVMNGKGLAPDGWRIASFHDWRKLRDYLGYYAEPKMKETGNLHWENQEYEATNESGFSALPGGYRDGICAFKLIRELTGWWTIDYDQMGLALYVELRSSINERLHYISCGFSVRCIKD